MLEKKLQILEEIFGTYYCSGGEYLFTCSKCKHHKKKLSFSLSKNCFKCWICNYSGKSIFSAVRSFGNQQQINAWSEFEEKVDFSDIVDKDNFVEEKVKLPKEFITLTSKKPHPATIHARQYLYNRGLSFNDVLWWKMGVCLEGKYKNRIIVPSFDMNGNVNYFVARTYLEHQVPYLNPPSSKDIIFNELFISWDAPITIVEGVFDAIVARNAIPLLGSTLREDSYVFQKIVPNCPKVFVALDPDAKEKEKQIMLLLASYGVEVWKINVKLFKDVGSMLKEEFNERKKNALKINSDNDLEYLINSLSE